MSLVKHMRMTLTATRTPLCILCHTVAEPPYANSTEPCEQSGRCIDAGTMRYRLHVLQSSLNNLCRSRFGSV